MMIYLQGSKNIYNFCPYKYIIFCFWSLYSMTRVQPSTVMTKFDDGKYYEDHCLKKFLEALKIKIKNYIYNDQKLI